MKTKIQFMLSCALMAGYAYAADNSESEMRDNFGHVRCTSGTDEHGRYYYNQLTINDTPTEVLSSFDLSGRPGPLRSALTHRDLRALEVQYCLKAQALQPALVRHRGKVGAIVGLALGFGIAYHLLKPYAEERLRQRKAAAEDHQEGPLWAGDVPGGYIAPKETGMHEKEQHS